MFLTYYDNYNITSIFTVTHSRSRQSPQKVSSRVQGSSTSTAISSRVLVEVSTNLLTTTCVLLKTTQRTLHRITEPQSHRTPPTTPTSSASLLHPLTQLSLIPLNPPNLLLLSSATNVKHHTALARLSTHNFSEQHTMTRGETYIATFHHSPHVIFPRLQ